MKDLSLHICDLFMNSIKAKATKIIIKLVSNSNFVELSLIDNGVGFSMEELINIKIPFYKINSKHLSLGLSLFFNTCEKTYGYVIINSKKKDQTYVIGRMYKNNINTKPIGNLTDTIYLLFITNSNIDISFQYNNFIVNSGEIRKILGDVPLTEPSIMEWIKAYLTEGIESQN